MAVAVTVFDDAGSLAADLAGQIADGISGARDAGARYVLGCPGGRTPRLTYLALSREVRRRGLALDHVVIAMMDDYVLPDGDGFAHVAADAHFSCRRFAREEIAAVLNGGAAAPVPEEAVWFPDPADPAAYDGRLEQAGGIDLFLLASGGSDGHVAFNPPGAPRDSRTRIVRLAETTKADNLGTFPGFADLAEVPGHGVTVGIDTIAGLSRRLVLVVTGAHKREALRRISGADAYDPGWPATVVTEGADAAVYADRAAAGRPAP
ncbi:6-phosphogluconolactonase [Nonomuraea roseola]|uniref:6-phosphogluconolactonase n=1 Tax=Nonomuraea roseola TaxID=46179 RepID=A0ABV5QB91_9ACTN